MIVPLHWTRRAFVIVAWVAIGCGGGSSDAEADGTGGAAGASGSSGTDAGVDADAPEELAPLVEGPLVDLVDPLIGTGGIGFGVGSVYPGPALPYAMIHPGPDTGTNGRDPNITHCAGYYYRDQEIFGFSHTRLQGTGVPDMGNVLVMPTDGFTATMAEAQGYRSTFSHDTETARPGYYAVTLDTSGVRAELTTARRAAIHRYEYPAGATPTVVFDPTHFAGQSGEVADANVRVEADGRVLGFVNYLGPMSRRDHGRGLEIWFVAEIDRSVISSRVFTSDGTVTDGARFDGTGGGLAVELGDGGTVHLRIAISFVSEAQAVSNLETEAADFDFDGMRARAEATWEDVLGKIRVAGGSEAQQRIFYSALYRAFLMPTSYTEAGGAYRGMDGAVHQADGFEYYSDLSLWDTFRSLHPLVTLISPGHARDFARSIVRMIEEGGAVPRWALANVFTGTMLGSSADVVVAGTYLKGVTDFDAETAYQAMRRQAFEPKPDGARGPWRADVEKYDALGYVPNDDGVGDAVSKTLEYAYDDWALANLAEALGHTDDAATLRRRAGSWQNLWDPVMDLVRPKDSAGSFTEPFDALGHGGPYVEGNAIQYSWYVPHDGVRLVAAFEGEQAFVDKLTEFFEKSETMKPVADGPHHLVPDLYYWHSNEPVIHAAYLFNDARRPDLARRWSREALDTQYRDAPDGLPGNDDGGTMSAWYVFTAMGFYPIAGGTEYWLGQPVFPRVVIAREEGDIEIRAPEAEDGVDLGRVTVDGEVVERRIDHAQIRGGAVLEFRGE